MTIFRQVKQTIWQIHILAELPYHNKLCYGLSHVFLAIWFLQYSWELSVLYEPICGTYAPPNNFYMKLLGEVIYLFELWCHHYTDDTRLYLSYLDWLSEVVRILSQGLEAVQVWMGRNHLWLNPTKTKWLWIIGSSRSEYIPSLVLDELALPPSRLVHNLKVFLDWQLLLEEQVTAVARKAYVQFHLILQLHPFLDCAI